MSLEVGSGDVSLSPFSKYPHPASRMNLKDLTLVKAVSRFESIGFMEWHARVLQVLLPTPLSLREIARQTGLFQYHVRGILQDLVGLQLVEYTREGVNLVDEEEMLGRLVACCESDDHQSIWDYEAAFEVVVPRVIALEKRFDRDG
ncbi:MAG: hypothetical protein Q8P05_02385 [Candidatus Diapherotrites archaeon]|nr:hypothetical protein [Candidatus Diapherotrites archaeon]MDZ4256273.1 hypothetical protein [archaeon]